MDRIRIFIDKTKDNYFKNFMLNSFSISFVAKTLIFLFVLFSATCLYANDIKSKAAVVIEGNSGKILYAKNPHLRLPPASTTKLVTAMVAIDRINLNTIVTISNRASNIQSVSPRLIAGERYSIKDLLYLSLMRSVNGAAVAIAEAVAGSEEAFVNIMNDKIHSMGLQNTKFINSSGLPGGEQYTTAYDLSIIMKESMNYPEIIEIINTRTKDISNGNGRQFFVKNTNYLLWKDDDHIGGKTGYTRAAGHCLVSASNKGDAILIAAILGEKDRNELWHDTYSLFSKAEDILRTNSEPVIYYSDIKNKPVVLATYKQKEVSANKKKANVKIKSKSKKKNKKALATSQKNRNRL